MEVEKRRSICSSSAAGSTARASPAMPPGAALKVGLCEMHDFASATTSASSSKLIHGGLRYLEHYDFRLVREALQRARGPAGQGAALLALPAALRAAARAASAARAGCCAFGLCLYDHLDWRMRLAQDGKRSGLQRSPKFGAGLKPSFTRTASPTPTPGSTTPAWSPPTSRRRASVGAERFARHRMRDGAPRRAGRNGALLELIVSGRECHGGATVEAPGAPAWSTPTGPWVKRSFARRAVTDIQTGKARAPGQGQPHRRAASCTRATTPSSLQNKDGRIAFVIPYERAYSVIGTTDIRRAGAGA